MLKINGPKNILGGRLLSILLKYYHALLVTLTGNIIMFFRVGFQEKYLNVPKFDGLYQISPSFWIWPK